MSYPQLLVARRYRLLSLIGRGGMGRVWLARDETLHRDVAVKEVVLPEGMSVDERTELCERMLREARAAGRLNHPNVVGVYDVVQAEGRPWIVMEIVRSRSLYQVVKEDGPLSPRRTAEIGLAVLSALRAAHRAGVWHRDVKPGNVLLADDGRVVLTDFGLATLEGDGTVTRPGVILGSAQYIAPERARDGHSGPESDMWSLGATLYAAVEGRSPFARETSMATLTALATAPPDPPRRAGPLRPVLIGLLRKNPKHRMHAADAERLLRRIADGTSKTGRRVIHQRQVAPDELEAVAPAADAADQPVPHGEPVRVRTVTEETFEQQPRRRDGLRLGSAVVIGVVIGVVAGSLYTAMIWRGGQTQARAGAGSTTAAPLLSSAPALSAAMGVQACVRQEPESEAAVPAGDPAQMGPYGPPQNWKHYRDPAGFRIFVPDGWRLSRVGPLVCFRDPTSPKAIAVYPQGRLAGDPVALLDAGEGDWRNAAELSDYTRVALVNVPIDDAGADLEYTYTRPDTVRLHGVNRMVRLEDEVFILFWLTTDFAWSTDRALRDVVQPSFGLAQ
jgi:hypothetical protein